MNTHHVVFPSFLYASVEKEKPDFVENFLPWACRDCRNYRRRTQQGLLGEDSSAASNGRLKGKWLLGIFSWIWFFVALLCLPFIAAVRSLALLRFRKVQIATALFLLFAGTCGLGIWLISGGESTKELAAYDYELQLVRVAGDDEKEFDLLQKIIKDYPNEAKYRLQLAQSLWNRGQPDQALKKIQRIVRLDGSGFGPAHKWYAQKLMVVYQNAKSQNVKSPGAKSANVKSPNAASQNFQKARPPSKKEIQEICLHFEQYLLFDPFDDKTRFVLANNYFRLQQFENVERHLMECVKSDQSNWAKLVMFYLRTGQKAKLHKAARKAEDYFSDQLSKKPNDAKLLESKAKVLIAQGRYLAAEDYLKRSFDFAESPSQKSEMASFYYAWARRLPFATKSQYATQAEIIRRGLALDGGNERLLNRLATISYGCQQEIEIPSELLELFNTKKATSGMYIARGTKAIVDERWDQAIADFEQATTLNPNNPIIANNLANAVLKKGDKETLKKCRPIVESAIKRFPANPNLRHTLGQLEFSLGNWEKAITHLETVVTLRLNEPEIFLTLAKAYSKVGNDNLANHFAQKAKTLVNAKESPK